MKLVSYNIQYGFGSDGRYDLARAAKVVGGADIIALQEVERHWLRSNEDDQPEILSRLLPDYYWVYGPAFDMDASEKLDGRVINRRRSSALCFCRSCRSSGRGCTRCRCAARSDRSIRETRHLNA
jgi:endonuclease/exonuclease/phosphatase family metal-dependent hydrolase